MTNDSILRLRTGPTSERCHRVRQEVWHPSGSRGGTIQQVRFVETPGLSICSRSTAHSSPSARARVQNRIYREDSRTPGSGDPPVRDLEWEINQRRGYTSPRYFFEKGQEAWPHVGTREQYVQSTALTDCLLESSHKHTKFWCRASFGCCQKRIRFL